MAKIIERLQGNHVLFVSTKNKDYIRNQQEIRMIQENAETYKEIVYMDKSYFKRVFKVYLACCWTVWKNADFIFVGFAPQLIVPFLRFWLKRKYVVIDFFISFYDTFVCDRKYFKRNSLGAMLLHRLDEITLHSCHHIIVDTKADKKFFSREFHVPMKKIEVMYLEADKRIYDKNRFCTAKMSVLYFGSLLPLQGVEIILGAAKLLEKEKDIYFTIIGTFKNTECMDIEKFINVEFYAWMPQQKLAEKIAGADLCLAGHFNADIEKASRTIPGKAYIYEAMDKPMILGNNAANRELFQEDDNHFYVEMGSASALAKKIITIRNGWKKL